MDNYEIADRLSLLSRLMDIHGENAFKSKSYSVAAFTLEKLPQQVAELKKEQIIKIRNIGESAGQKIIELVQTGELVALKEILEKTPAGVIDMLAIKGLGPKKIHALWKQMNISSLDELQSACEEHRIASAKGFGEKTEQKILESIAFKKSNTGKFLYAHIETFAEALTQKLAEKFPDEKFEITGEYRRQLEVITQLEWVTTTPEKDLIHYLEKDAATVQSSDTEQVTLAIENNVIIRFHLASRQNFAAKLFTTSSSESFLEGLRVPGDAASENEILQANGLPDLPPFLRENKEIFSSTAAGNFNNLIQVSDIKGLIHCHSDWSDGAYSIEEMAEALIDLGFEYMVISDHSKAAYYANGLTEDRIKQQHEYVDKLNEKLKPFKIFRSIECDILGDGRLDYDDHTLSTFDLVITSIHSNLEMNEEKAMGRLLGAIQNPYTRILGHMTGRLLLKRNGYPVDHKEIIDACAENDVVIEINANPRRLDMDWRWIDYALQKNVMLSIDPDAHTIDEFQLLKYGVLVAQKGGLTAARNLSSLNLNEFEKFISKKKSPTGDR